MLWWTVFIIAILIGIVNGVEDAKKKKQTEIKTSFFEAPDIVRTGQFVLINQVRLKIDEIITIQIEESWGLHKILLVSTQIGAQTVYTDTVVENVRPVYDQLMEIWKSV